MQARGFIFQNGFLGGVWGSIQNIPEKVDFWAKKLGFIQENPKNLTFHITWGSIQEWGCIQEDTVCTIKLDQIS